MPLQVLKAPERSLTQVACQPAVVVVFRKLVITGANGFHAANPLSVDGITDMVIEEE